MKTLSNALTALIGSAVVAGGIAVAAASGVAAADSTPTATPIGKTPGSLITINDCQRGGGRVDTYPYASSTGVCHGGVFDGRGVVFK
ncbi:MULTISPECIES: hypothetical protein [unclassified Nocardia]|uniref:hypothetical protein n=1 Tax=unclassified Nocardia TaxID=2637762 RepID=UPI002E1FB7A6